MIANCNCFFLAALFVLTVTVTSSVCEIGNSIESEETPTAKSNLIEKLRTQIKIKQRELENAEKINKNFERMIQLVNIMGQVDTFLTDRTRLVLRKLALLADDMETPTKKGGSQHRIKF